MTFWARGCARFCPPVRCGEIDASAPRNALADLRDVDGGAVCRHAQVDDERVERPHPQVVVSPPHDLVEQTGIDTGPDHRGSPDRDGNCTTRSHAPVSNPSGAPRHPAASDLTKG
jgi:hypothetical protein